MTTLDDLLALLPDNTTGDIDAVDLRTIVTELWNYTVAVQTDLNLVGVEGQNAVVALNARVTALEQDANKIGDSFPYSWATNGQAPANKHVTMDQPWLNFATKVLVSETASDDRAPHFDAVDAAVSAKAWITTADGAKLECNITGPSVDMGTYREIPISVVSIEGAQPSNNEDVTLTLVAVTA